MSEWDKAKKYLLFYAKDDSIIPRRDIRNQLKDAVEEGDKMQREGDQMQSHIHHMDYENTLLKAEIKEVRFQLSCTNEALGKTFNKLADEQQKLEAIRDVLKKECQTEYCVNMTEDKCRRIDCLVFEFKEVLGVFSEMQEKKQQ